MKTLLFLFICMIGSSLGIGLTEGGTNTFFTYALGTTMVVSAIVLLTGVAD